VRAIDVQPPDEEVIPVQKDKDKPPKPDKPKPKPKPDHGRHYG
jgi:hypothetical protein